MATTVNYYLNAATFATATTIFTDVGLTTPAPDGFYSDGVGNVREQLLGVLQALAACAGCGTPITLCYSVTTALDACCGCL